MEIKYKAWLIKEQKMVVPSSINWNKGYGGALEIFVDNPDWSVEEITSGRKFNPKKPPFFTYINHVHEEHLKERPQEFVLLQWTFLNAQNNLEIYNGSILKCRNLFENEKGFDFGVVTHEPYYGCYVVHFNSDRQSESLTNYLACQSEVVGDIYQNADLLNT
tara:strand:+ start:1612 stop:2097 length:486 start_codon:yes stop_codon:yes gene_type:complete